MFRRYALHSLIASPMQAERSSADGLNSANAAVDSALRTKASAANIPRRTLVMRAPLGHDGATATTLRRCGFWHTTRAVAVMAITKMRISARERAKFSRHAPVRPVPDYVALSRL